MSNLKEINGRLTAENVFESSMPTVLGAPFIGNKVFPLSSKS
jgi:hypothetical protein